jgi:hypothetical protein
MITGVYLPEINGAVGQCSQIIKKLNRKINFSVLTTTKDSSASGFYNLDKATIYKVHVPSINKMKKFLGLIHFYLLLLSILKYKNIIHIHGYSTRNALVILIARAFQKKIILKMTSFGIDDPISIKEGNFLLWKIFSLCNSFVAISPAFSRAYFEAGLPIEKLNFIIERMKELDIEIKY